MELTDSPLLFHFYMIILIRHATPIVSNTRCSSQVAQARMIEYNQTQNIKYDETTPFVPEIKAILNCFKSVTVFASNLPRAYGTAHHIFEPLRIKIHTNAIFSEFDLNILRLPFIQLSTKQWLFISPLAWLSGMNNQCQTLQQEISRSKAAANLLLKTHSPDSAVVLVGHGFMNKFIKKSLKSSHWTSKNHKKNGCFEYQCFTKDMG